MYTLSKLGVLKKGAEVIPLDDSTLAYQDYVKWLAEGNGPEIIDDTEVVLHRIEVSAWQIRKALNALGLREVVETMVARSGNIEMQDGWNHAPTFYSDQQLTLTLAQALGKSESELYDIFQLAKGL